jgi:hypothetical protein
MSDAHPAAIGFADNGATIFVTGNDQTKPNNSEDIPIITRRSRDGGTTWETVDHAVP